MTEKVRQTVSCVLLGLGVVFAVSFVPVYYFFIHCPNPSELLAIRRQIKVGMTVSDLDALPVQFTVYRNEKNNGRPHPLDSNLTGKLVATEPCSVQCEGWLTVECRDGIVTSVKLEVYNDLDHGTREVK